MPVRDFSVFTRGGMHGTHMIPEGKTIVTAVVIWYTARANGRQGRPKRSPAQLSVNSDSKTIRGLSLQLEDGTGN